MNGLHDLGVSYVYFFTGQGIDIRLLTSEQISDARQHAIAEAMVEWCERGGFHSSPAVQMKDIPESTLEFYGKSRLCQEVLMVEGEHVRQLNWRKWGMPRGIELWAKVDGPSLPQAYEKTLEGIRRSRAHYASYGLDPVVSCVEPVMFHAIARAGCGVIPKFMGMSYSPVTAAIALGAALQYQTKFWIDLEMWSQGSGNSLPGHSREEFRSNLLLAYWLGVDHIHID